MAPLVNEFIPAQIDLIFAFFIGIFFGYILEQAGFSSSRKLVGLFYGYDFTVLRVFFYSRINCNGRSNYFNSFWFVKY